ncbi:hypothetical protein [Pseudoxanthomonas mexicana]|uniref:hypothetical protein n=2 Tax=Pseudoxanthomonas mexicana TaxID=128785 RepID=UPI0024E27731|nr:hypothetical protein [Pseudoxanthomonas mexicana]HMM23355.1 hypothetical protein [Pseudoxanthomonas mexicana]
MVASVVGSSSSAGAAACCAYACEVAQSAVKTASESALRLCDAVTMLSPPKGHVLAMSCKKIRRGTGGITAESERNSPCVNAKLTPASQRGILHCVDTQAITLAWISH